MNSKFFIMLIVVLIPVTIKAQPEKEVAKKSTISYAYTLGINFGIDNDIHAYRMNPNYFGNNFYSNKYNSSIGLEFGIMISKKIRTRLEVKNVKISYNADWENANIPSLKETTVNLFMMDFNFKLDYMVFDNKKFQVFVTPLVKWEINADSEEKNISYNGIINWANYNGIITENPKSLLGGGVSTSIKYNLAKNVSLTATPVYTLFFRNFVKSNDKSYQRISLDLGVEFNFY
jgi:hypothetical protein